MKFLVEIPDDDFMTEGVEARRQDVWEELAYCFPNVIVELIDEKH